MKLNIDNCDSLPGWTPSDINCSVWALNEVPEYIANDLNHSLVFKFNAGSNNSYIKKLYNINVSSYNEIVLNIYSRNHHVNSLFLEKSNYAYSIQFNDSMTPVLLPTYNQMVDITISLSGITQLDYIKITNLSSIEDFLVLSHIVAVKDEIPLDIFKETKAGLEVIRDSITPPILLDTVSCSANDKSITLTGNRYYCEKYQVIKITDGLNTEYHQLFDHNEKQYTFSDLYDGNKILHNYTNANIYLFLPVEYGKRQSEMILPGISIQGMTGKPILRNSKVSKEIYNYKTTGPAKVRYDLQYYEWKIDIDIESRSDELLATMSKIVRNFVAREKLWINGREYRIYFKDDPVYIEANEYYNQIPKIQYSFMIEIKEDIFDNSDLVKTSNILYNITNN